MDVGFRRLVAGALAVGCAVAAGSGTAVAATTVGQASPEGSRGVFCQGTFDLLQLTTEPDAPSYIVGADGVITSFSIRSEPGEWSATYKLKTYSSTSDPSAFTVEAVSDEVERPGAGLNTYSTRIPVRAGQRVGLHLKGSDRCGHGVLNQSDNNRIGFLGGSDAQVGEKVVAFSPFSGGNLMNLEARVEPDADRDGYGDETQDLCPSDASTQGACPPPPDTTVKVDGPLTPFASNGSSRFKLGTVLEVRVKPSQGGSLITDLKPQVNIVRTGNPSGPQTPTVAVLKRAADAGKTARYSAQFGQYQFYAATLKSQFNGGKDLVPGQYRVDVSDPVFPGAAHKVARNFAIVP